MYNKTMYELGSHRSVIRDLFEFGKKRTVYDVSLGNPNVPAPDGVKEAAEKLFALPDNTVVHGYTSAQGDADVRKAVADSINARFSAGVTPDLIYMTCGAAASLTVTLNALCEEGDEFILLAPFFPEYSVFVKAAGGTPVVVPFDPAPGRMLRLEVPPVPLGELIGVGRGHEGGEDVVDGVDGIQRRRGGGTDPLDPAVLGVEEEPDLVRGSGSEPDLLDRRDGRCGCTVRRDCRDSRNGHVERCLGRSPFA